MTERSGLLGRESHLAALHDAIASARRGAATVVCVHGGSGMGKSTLLHRFLDEVHERDPSTTVLEGRCYPQETVPYKALDGVVDDLSRHLAGLPDDEVQALLPERAAALARLFPVLMRIAPIAAARTDDDADSRGRRRQAFEALRTLLARVAARRTLVVVIDDLHWGDLDSVAVLTEILRPPAPPPLLLVVAYRSDDAATSPVLLALRRALAHTWDTVVQREVEVRELAPEESEQIARDALGAAQGALGLAPTIAREARGNPFFIEELARAVQVDEEASAAVVAGTTLEAALARRLSTLPPDARRLLDVLAVAASPLERDLAARAAVLGNEEAAAVAALRAGRLLRATGTEGEPLEPYHHRIREAVVGGLDPSRLRELHARLAETMEASGRVDPERLAAHFGGAGRLDRCAFFSVAAADRAAAALAFDRAAQWYRQALDLPGAVDAERRALQVKLGDALANAGRGPEAARAYLSAVGGSDRRLALEWSRRAAEQLLRSGHLDDGLRALSGVLEAVGMKLPSHRRALLALGMGRLQLRLRGLRFAARDEADVPAEDLLRIDTCWAVATGLGFVDTLRGAVFQSRGLLLALRAGEPRRIARALAVETAYASVGGGRTRRRTERLGALALAVAERLGQPQAVAHATLASGIASHFEGRWKDCRTILGRADALLRDPRAAGAFDLDNTTYCMLFSLLFLGELEELARRLPACLADARDRGDLYFETNLRLRVSYFERLVHDDIDGARRELDDAIGRWSQAGFHNQHWWHLLGSVQVDLYAGDGDAAWRRVEETWPRLARSFALRIQLIALLAHHLRGQAALAARPVRSGAAASAAQTIARARMPWADPLADMLRAAQEGAAADATPALSRLRSAEARFRRADMPFHEIVARRCRGALLGGAAGEPLVAEADEELRRRGIARPDRFARMLAPGPWEG